VYEASFTAPGYDNLAGEQPKVGNISPVTGGFA
jgi:hypothetical protein